MAARRLHGLIYATIAFCCLVIVVCGVALGTDQWVTSEATASNSSLRIKVSYGLFKGQKTKYGASESTSTSELKVVCSSMKCMFSCGITADQRKQDLNQLIDNKGADDSKICKAPDNPSRSMLPNQDDGSVSGKSTDKVFLNLGLFVATIGFLGIAIAFSAIGVGLAVYNTYRTPIQPVLSVLGLFIWNGISAFSTFMALILWGIAFATGLSKNAGISDTLDPNLKYSSKGNASLGISFWILILACLFSLINLGILKYRSWKIIQMEAANVKVMTETLESGDILLF